MTWPTAARLAAAVIGAGLSSRSALLRRRQAGGQLEEPLVDSVRTALSAAMSTRAPPDRVRSDTKNAPGLPALAGRDERRLHRRKSELDAGEFLQTVWYESKRAGLDRRWCWA